MSDQNRRQDFNEANAIAEYRRQEALTDAYITRGSERPLTTSTGSMPSACRLLQARLTL
jgi:hypothetical protein